MSCHVAGAPCKLPAISQVVIVAMLHRSLFISAPCVQGQKQLRTSMYLVSSLSGSTEASRGSGTVWGMFLVGWTSSLYFDILQLQVGALAPLSCSPRALTAKSRRFHLPRDASPLTFWRRNYFFLILAHPVYKMWIIQEPNVRIMKQTAFWRENNGEYIPCLKYSVPIFVE